MKYTMNRRTILTAAISLAAASVAPQVFAQAAKVDSALPEYKAVSGVTGKLNSIGSDTLNNLMTFWAEGFRALYPNVKIQIEGKGSATAPPALIEGTAQLGPMSRPMKGTEIDAFEKKYGYKPTEFKVAIDALAVFVHKDNPIKFIPMRHVDAIFSSTRKLGGTPVETWGDLGLTGPWASKPISIFGRNSASGTYGFFKDVALKGGDFKPSVKEQPGSSSVVQGVASDLGGIGYSGIGYATSGARAVPLEGANSKAFEPTFENSLSGKYPLARFLYIYVNKKPGQPMDPLQAEFIKFVASKAGQEVVIKDGYFGLPAKIASDEIKKLNK
jgi:phosphate transport system substrate-binding protein